MVQSEEITRYFKCTRKKRYETRAVAKKALVKVQNKAMGKAVRVYKCKHCKGWHIGGYNILKSVTPEELIEAQAKLAEEKKPEEPKKPKKRNKFKSITDLKLRLVFKSPGVVERVVQSEIERMESSASWNDGFDEEKLRDDIEVGCAKWIKEGGHIAVEIDLKKFSCTVLRAFRWELED